MRTLYALSVNRNITNVLLLSPGQIKILPTVEICRKTFSRLLTYKNRFVAHCPRTSLYWSEFFKDGLFQRYTPSPSCCVSYHRLGRCATTRVLGKQNRKNERCRDMQSCERVANSVHIRQAKLKDARRRMARKVEELKENVLTVPNALCVLRMVATPFLGYLVLQEFYAASLGIFVFAGFTDLIDGYIARTFPSQQSMIGSFLDPAADKLLVATLFLTLTANGLIPVPLTSVIILRDVCLFGAGFYIRYVSLPPPKTLGRYFDVSFATAKLRPTTISKLNTMVQLSLIACSLAAPVFGYVDHYILPVLWYVTGTTTVLSAASYLYCKDTYRLLNSPDTARKLASKGS